MLFNDILQDLLGFLPPHLTVQTTRGTWLVQMVKGPASGQVMTSRFVSSSPALGCLLSAWSPLGILCSPLSLRLPHSLSKINENVRKKKKNKTVRAAKARIRPARNWATLLPLLPGLILCLSSTLCGVSYYDLPHWGGRETVGWKQRGLRKHNRQSLGKFLWSRNPGPHPAFQHCPYGLCFR